MSYPRVTGKRNSSLAGLSTSTSGIYPGKAGTTNSLSTGTNPKLAGRATETEWIPCSCPRQTGTGAPANPATPRQQTGTGRRGFAGKTERTIRGTEPDYPRFQPANRTKTEPVGWEPQKRREATGRKSNRRETETRLPKVGTTTFLLRRPAR